MAPIADLEVSDDGSFALRTLNDQRAIAQAFLDNGVVSSKNFKNADQVLIGIQAMKALKLEPAMALKNAAYLNGVFCVWGEIPMSVVKASGKLLYCEEYRYEILPDKTYRKIEYNNYNLDAVAEGAVCEVMRIGEERPVRHYFTRTKAKRANLLNKPGAWQTHTEIMLKRRARGVALMDAFPDVLHCIAQKEVDIDGVPEDQRDTIVRLELENGRLKALPTPEANQQHSLLITGLEHLSWFELVHSDHANRQAELTRRRPMCQVAQTKLINLESEGARAELKLREADKIHFAEQFRAMAWADLLKSPVKQAEEERLARRPLYRLTEEELAKLDSDAAKVEQRHRDG